jgi:alpha-beta hydrolase superfamily lysophospholipase
MSPFVLQRFGEPRICGETQFPGGTALAGVLIVHGHGEHGGCYRHVSEAWVARGFAVARFDLRGHGRSGGRRSHIQHFDDYLRDAHAVLSELGKDARWRELGPPIVFGHSLGALIAIQLVLSAQGDFRGLAMTSPYLALAGEVSAVLQGIGRTLSRSWPTFTLSSPIRSRVLTHDVQKMAECDADPLRTSAVTARFFTEVERVQALCQRSAGDLTLPLYCRAAGDDRVVSLAAAQRWLAGVRSKDKEVVVVPDAFHELLNEVDRGTHIAAFADRFERWAKTR